MQVSYEDVCRAGAKAQEEATRASYFHRLTLHHVSRYESLVSAVIEHAKKISAHARQSTRYCACYGIDGGTFGVSSASLWWSRLFGIIGRVVGRALLCHAAFQLVFVDDMHANFFGPRKYHNALVWLTLYLMAGTPFVWKKFKGGPLVAFIGYELDYEKRLIGLSDSRGTWLVNWIRLAKEARFVVQTKKFAEFLGRLGFVSRLLYWLKPHLAPLYAWSAATHRCAVGRLPDAVILTLLYIEETFLEMEYKVSPRKVDCKDWPLFYTDAKCADVIVVLGGWEAPGPARWFSVRVSQEDAPYLYDEKGKTQWASASAELLATLAALWAFGHLKASTQRTQVLIVVSAITDNKGNESLSRKQSSTKWPLMLVNIQLSHCLLKASMRLNLVWRQREENTLADDLTNERFASHVGVPLIGLCLPLPPLSQDSGPGIPSSRF